MNTATKKEIEKRYEYTVQYIKLGSEIVKLMFSKSDLLDEIEALKALKQPDNHKEITGKIKDKLIEIDKIDQNISSKKFYQQSLDNKLLKCSD